MNKKTTYTRDSDKPFDDSDTDYSEFDKLTDEEVHQAALDDPDAQPLTEEQLKKLKPVKPRNKG